MRSSSAARTIKLAFTSISTRPNTCLSCIRTLQRDPPRRLKHNVPELRHIKNNKIPGFLLEDNYRIAWTDYQQWLLDNLNRLIKDTEAEALSPKDIALLYAHDANHAAAFNYASMAHNNAFFFKGISENPSPLSNNFKTIIESDFSSLSSLRDTMITTADTMFGPGFVWLVVKKEFGTKAAEEYWKQQGRPKLKLLTTYLAGSPYARAHYRKQGQDAMTTDFNVRPNETGIQMAARNQSHVGSGHTSQQKPSAFKGDSLMPPGAADVVPLLCVNTWQNAWLPQYGVKGKMDYLERWWDRIDWRTVEENYKRQ